MSKKASVKERVLETASQLFYEKGYNNTGINEVIEKAGVAKASLYANFRTKEDLCIAYLIDKDRSFRKALNDFVQAKPKGQQRILALFDFLFDFFHSKNFRGCWCLNTLSELPRDNVTIRSEIVNQKKSFRDYVKILVSENAPKANSEKVGNKIYLLYEGAITESYLNQEEWPIAEAKAMAKMQLRN